MNSDNELRSLAGCVAYVIGAKPPDVLRESELELRQWLSGRNLGIVKSEPTDGFTWPGHFLARRRGSGTWAVMFGAPPGMVFDPLGSLECDFSFDSLTRSFDSFAFLVPYELGAVRSPGSGWTGLGLVRNIALAESAEAPMREVETAEAIAGRGLRGDRYEKKAGTFTDTRGKGNDLTLVESEALSELSARGIELPAVEARRNIVTEGVELDALIGHRFRVGEVECFGQRRCEPCAHLERLTKPGVLRGLVYRGGLRADVLTDGVINTGDRIEVL